MKKSWELEIPIPVMLNCWKHHAAFIKKIIYNINPGAINNIEEFLPFILTIGESQMDLYVGNLSPYEIAVQVKNKITKLSINSKNDYQSWIINEGKEYKLICLSDNSFWALRIGMNNERFIHLHPARNSINTLRVRAATLKTAIVAMIWTRIHDGLAVNIEIINKVRKDYLSEPPIKKMSTNKGLLKLFSALEYECPNDTINI
jgi:hypothetical protein